MNLPTATFLKAALKILHVYGLEIVLFARIVSTIEARRLYFDITYEELLDTIPANKYAASLDAALEGQESENILTDIR